MRLVRLPGVIVAFATMLAMIAGLPRIAFAQVGARNFYDPLITQDANPSNEITNSPGWAKTGATGTQVSYSFSIEKEITENVDFLFGEAINDTARRNSTASAGLDDQQVLIKWAYYMNVEHELRLALALDLFVPKGDFSQGAVPYWRGGPMLLMSKGAGDIPNIGWLRYLRPFALQVDATYRFRWNGPQFQEAVFNSAVSYQLDYLANSGVHFPGESFLRPIDFFNEFNYSAEVAGNKKGQLPDWRATPGIAYQTQYFEIDVGTQIALSTAAKKSFQSEGLFELDIYYDQFFPQLGPMF